jgi:putative transposase
MLNDKDFNNYIRENKKLTAEGIEYISATRCSEPSRSVGMTTRSSVVSADVSEKMGWTIAAESHAEQSVLLDFEYDTEVIEYWDQPPPVMILKIIKSGRKRRTKYTPDFLVLTEEEPKVIEVKTRNDAEKLIKKHPEDWIKNGDDYVYLPAFEYFKNEFGIKYEVVTVVNSDLMIANNIKIILPCRREKKYSDNILNALNHKLDVKPYWRLDVLKEEMELDGYLYLIQMIDDQVLAFDLGVSNLGNPETCYVASAPELLITDESGAHASLEFDDIECHGDRETIRKALDKLERINSNEKSRSIRRWKAAIKVGRSNELSDLQVLIDMDIKSGNRKPRISPLVSNCLAWYLKEVFLKKKDMSIIQGHYDYCNFAKNTHPNIQPVSRYTFTKQYKKILPSDVGEAIGGRRLSNALALPTNPLERSVKATLPWMAASMDHALAKIYVVVYENSKEIFTKRPWISILVDIATKEVLAFTLSFENPSKRSCSRLIRSCVREHGQLPREVVLDHGTDFTSVYFRGLLAHYGITHTLRPTAHPRFGSEVERIFGEINSQWLSNRPGYSPNLKTQRSIDGSMRAENHAVLTLEDLYKELTLFITCRSEKPIGISNKSISVLYYEKLSQFSYIPIKITFDKYFLLTTAVEIGTYKIDFQRGVHIKDVHFYSSKLLLLLGESKSVDVRKDPENPYLIFAKIKNEWCACYSGKYKEYMRQRIVAQLSEGVLTYECSRFRKKISEILGIERAAIRQELDEKIEGEIGRKLDVLEPVVILNKIDFNNVRDLEVSSWSADDE